MKTLKLKPGKERSALRRHPWVFDTAIASGSADSGETVRLESSTHEFLGWAAFSPHSRIRARVWSFDQAQRIDADFFRHSLHRAIAARQLLDIPSDSRRLIHGEADGLPGLIVDQYGETLVAQFLSCGVERWKNLLADQLLALTGSKRLYERSDTGMRAREGLIPVNGWLRQGEPSAASDTEVILQEHGRKFSVDVAKGHKTGFYLDQRDNRQKFSQYAQRLHFKKVLNCYCYTGGFTIAALQGMRTGGALTQGGRVCSIDSSKSALALARINVVLNGFDAEPHEFLEADVNQSLRLFQQQGRSFDAIVLDPPKFAPGAAHLERAARAYKDINRLALKILAPGGVLFSFSCSGVVGVELFHKIVASAGIDAEVDGYITERLQGAPDHPMTLQFPEAEYLKGLVVIRRH